MRFEKLPIDGAFLVRIEPRTDARGFFARTFCRREFAEAGLPDTFVQDSISHNSKQGTVRGLHFQWPPSREGKLVRCTRGSLFDVLVDLRPDRASYLAHVHVVLNQESQEAVFVPPGVAHGFQTLADDTDVLYQMTDYYVPDLAAGVRWNDPAFGITWPCADAIVITDRDGSCTDFDRDAFEAELERRRRGHS